MQGGIVAVATVPFFYFTFAADFREVLGKKR